ncbi:hypothetical protein PUR59_04285 [Streptomyces sp. SP18ES09]|uniref:hypothetical protein n=1 Tax=Streptomyces sp. SP18ES09 TaxID=3002532 RepID=UPI002E772E1D|nr:hypothetical protein [Streptomyces sp. SP18ES09]MEE1814239.1 hypothetical protein [Streptomyces sp. SP18ES09]
MTTQTRAARARRDRTQTLTALTGRLDRIAAGSTAHLTRAEAALLAETIRALQADAHHLAQDRRGLARARSADIEKRIAAEETIREVEADRDAAREELAAVRAYDRALSEAYGPARPSILAIGGWVCGTCKVWVPQRLTLPHTCLPSPTFVELLQEGSDRSD